MKKEKLQKAGIIALWTISGLLVLSGVGASLSTLFTEVTEVSLPIAIGGYGIGGIFAVLSMAATLDKKDYTVEKKQALLAKRESELEESINKEKEVNENLVTKKTYFEPATRVENVVLNEYARENQAQRNPVLMKTRRRYKKIK